MPLVARIASVDRLTDRRIFFHAGTEKFLTRAVRTMARRSDPNKLGGIVLLRIPPR
jgi:hypothetical protein